MPHHVHPYAHRIGTLRDWKSHWIAFGVQYQKYLKGDVLLREYLTKHLRGMHVSDIETERNDKTWKIVIKTARPGLIIGRSGEGAVKLKGQVLSRLARWKIPHPKDIKIEIEEVRNPESNAAIVGAMVAEGLEKRMPFKRVIKQMLEKMMANRDVKGARIAISGRLGGADMSRREHVRAGNIPLQTIRADVDFAREKAYLPYGVIGIQVWIYKGEVFSKKQGAKQDVIRKSTT
ncbi:MAG: 30S ribosomal protein S3 [bacterium]|nr:30S ribosomal protein S3 [bacterium]